MLNKVASGVDRGTQKMADMETKLRAVNPKLTPMIDCTDDEARKAVTALNGVMHGDRALAVSEAKPRASGAGNGGGRRRY